MPAKKPPAVPQPANLTAHQMLQAIPTLERRLSELDAFDSRSLRERAKDAATVLHQKYEDFLVRTFGNDTVEYHRYHLHSFYESSGMTVMLGGGGPSPAEIAERYQNGVAKGARNLRTILELFQESLGDAGMPGGNPTRALEALNLHPEIADACVDLFKGGHYANAVEDACKALDLLVQMRAKRTNLSGTELMQLVFSPNNPVMKFNDQTNDSERSEQRGMMFLYSGAMLAFRNPRAHGLLDDEPEVAFEIIAFVNFLAKSLAKAQRV